ncbi:efflux RND transporter periplasmic adaptor subunit [Paenibacillus silviterrae]|uniref:efflux RND transporter periplasmic adaptor subunit n=1 Tax=Paenibacillus silviterrae TaxID=3242194 RepID=UPI002543E634|nr:HlyD family efflux transporter periplasmic adaptor subunit [Paenibacillus chinjuensis]
MNKKKAAILAAVAVVLCGGGTYAYIQYGGAPKQQQSAVQESTTPVRKGNLRSVISGTAQLEAQDLQMIVPPKEGMIKVINLSRNQTVKKGDLLLELTDSSLEERLETAKLTLSQQQADLNDLKTQAASLRMAAPAGGKLILSANISEGASVNKTTKVATIADAKHLTVTLPFLQEQASQLRAGDLVELTVDGFLLTKTGTVESVANSVKGDAKGNRLLDVKITVVNDGSLDAGLNVKGEANVGGVKIESAAQAALQYQTTTSVMAGVSGTISRLEIKENRDVRAGELIGVIQSDTLDKDITNKQLQVDQSLNNIKSLEDQLEKLKVLAPFDGVFSTDFADQKKNVLTSYPVGTTIGSNVQLGAVANLDTLQLPIKVDELDLPKIKVGQKAEVRVDAVSGKTFPAEVTQVSTVGTVTNGVSFYTVVLSLKNAFELKYGMTATADIIIEDKRDVLLLPVEAVTQRQGKRFVSLKKADGTVDANHEVKIGSNNSTMVEITEGLKEGDVVVSRSNTRNRTNLSQQEIEAMRQQFQQGARNQGGGGAPAGGAPGGFPAGGGGGGNAGGNR